MCFSIDPNVIYDFCGFNLTELLLLSTPVTSDLQLNCENRKLKYPSLSSRPCLDELLPSISDCIALEADADAADTGDCSPDVFTQYHQQVKGTARQMRFTFHKQQKCVLEQHFCHGFIFTHSFLLIIYF